MVVVAAIHPALAAGGLAPGARWPLSVGERLTIGLRRRDAIRVPLRAEALLGGHTAYVLERAGDGVRLAHTGHIGSARVAGVEVRAAVTLAVGELVELLTVAGEVGLALRVLAEP